MRVTTIRRVKRVGRKWKLVSAKYCLTWRPEEELLRWAMPYYVYIMDLNKLESDLTKK